MPGDAEEGASAVSLPPAAPRPPPPPPPRRPLAAAAAARDGSALALANVPPRWSESAGAFTLDFGGRVTAPSVKNFQLVAAAAGGGDDDDENTQGSSSSSPSSSSSAAVAKNHNKTNNKRASVLLQFGKTGADTFSMDLRGPLTPLQGFLICLTALDGKLAFE